MSLPKILSNGREISNALTQAHTQQLTSERVSGVLSTRTRLQHFLATPPLSLFKKLVILTLWLVQGLHMMLLAKAVPKGIKELGLRKVHPERMPPGTVRTRKGSRARNGFPPQKQPESENNYWG
jgi:hypothetical protein